jgi:hypothetical protein
MPAIMPSSQPSAMPTTMPSPYGLLGQQWWYLITAHSDVVADDFDIYKQRDIISGLNYAFDQFIIDTIADRHISKSITVVVNKLNLDDDSDDFYDHTNSNSNSDAALAESTATTTTTTTTAPMLDEDFKSSSKGGVNTMMSFRIHVWCSMHESMVSSTKALHQVEEGSAMDDILR